MAQPNNIDFEQKLKELQYRKLLMELEEEEEAKKEAKRREEKRLEGAKRDAEDAARAEEEKRIWQENCPHSSKDVSFIRGQRLGRTKDKKGNIVDGFLAFCQICKKRYDTYESIPPHLRSDPGYFGGPNGV